MVIPHPLDPRTARRRYVLLTALRWLPVGLVVPVSVLLMRARGLDLVTVGALMALHGALVVALELPTGGLADVLGRRPVLLISAVLNLSSAAVVAVAHDASQFAAGYVLLATGRALGSGPLEAWYVDTVHATDPDAELAPGLARGYAAESVALGLGAIGGGLLPLAFAGLDSGPEQGGLIVALSVSPLAAAGIGVVYAGMLAALLVEPPRSSVRPRVGEIFRSVPETVAAGLRLAGRDRLVLRLLAASWAMGFTLSALEVLSPVQFAALLGGEREASGAYGLLVAGAFLASAAGSALGPATARLLGRPSVAAVVATTLAAACLLVLGATPDVPSMVALAGAAYVGVYLLASVPSAIKGEALHNRVGTAERATMLSVESLLLQAGGILGTLTLPRLADAHGFSVAWAAAAAVLAASALLLLRLPARESGRAGYRERVRKPSSTSARTASIAPSRSSAGDSPCSAATESST